MKNISSNDSFGHRQLLKVVESLQVVDLGSEQSPS